MCPLAPLFQKLLLPSKISYGMEYLPGQFESAVLTVSPHSAYWFLRGLELERKTWLCASSVQQQKKYLCFMNSVWATIAKHTPSGQLWRADTMPARHSTISSSYSIVSGLSRSCGSGLHHTAVLSALPCEKHRPSSLLWCFPHVKVGVCRYSLVWTTDFYCYCHNSDDSFLSDRHFLSSHYPCCSSDSISCGPETTLFHVCSSPGGGDSFPQHSWHPPATQGQSHATWRKWFLCHTQLSPQCSTPSPTAWGTRNSRKDWRDALTSGSLESRWLFFHCPGDGFLVAPQNIRDPLVKKLNDI